VYGSAGKKTAKLSLPAFSATLFFLALTVIFFAGGCTVTIGFFREMEIDYHCCEILSISFHDNSFPLVTFTVYLILVTVSIKFFLVVLRKILPSSS
jgi:hypothetical protein